MTQLASASSPEPLLFQNNNLPPSSPIDSEDDIQVTSIVENPIVRPGGSRGDPIVIIESSPIKPRATKFASTSAPTHPFFKARPRQRSPTPASSLSATCHSWTPYPTRDTQHTRGPQGVYQPSASHQTVLSRAAYKELSPAASLPDGHRNHPAIERLVHALHHGDTSASQKLWTDKWRPTRADQVLGNEENALFLRNWLRELQVELVPHSEPPPATRVLSSKGKGKAAASENPKKRRITREVSKRSRKKQRIKSNEEDWIVPDGDIDDEEEPEHPVRVQDNDDYAPPIPRSNSPASPYTSAFSVDKLSNTIVLSGPSGSGKTAAVYACADEMDWEVFEVYPGIGKRNSTNLDNLVGQVGKNHLVSKAHVREEDPSGSQFATLFQGREKHGLSRKDDDTPANSTVNQSLILLEEVDILFKEDANFWPAVITLIKDCKRPVICTCNGLFCIMRLIDTVADSIDQTYLSYPLMIYPFKRLFSLNLVNRIWLRHIYKVYAPQKDPRFPVNISYDYTKVPRLNLPHGSTWSRQILQHLIYGPPLTLFNYGAQDVPEIYINPGSMWRIWNGPAIIH